jgi:transcriptional regulator with XRE-family HTH domain
MPPAATVDAIKKTPALLNVIGPHVRKLRTQRGWTQDRLAVKLQLAGWDVSRNSVTTLENRQRRVPDLELLVIARVLGVKADELFPRSLRGKYLRELWPSYRTKLSRGQVPPA